MSEENVEIVARFYPDSSVDLASLFADKDAMTRYEAPLRSFIHPDVESVFDRRFASLSDARGTVHKGIDAFREMWRDWLSAWKSSRIIVEELVPLTGSRVLALVEFHGRPKTGDVEMSLAGAAIWTLIDGQVTRLELFMDRDQALEAAGLSE